MMAQERAKACEGLSSYICCLYRACSVRNSMDLAYDPLPCRWEDVGVEPPEVEPPDKSSRRERLASVSVACKHLLQ